MIITVTLNAAIDRTLAVPNFRLGRRHRSVEQRSMAGGKGVNVARALKKLGQPVIATGVAGGSTGTRIIEQLTEEAILNDFVRIREESRTSIAVVDPTSGEQTEINERGPDGVRGRARAVRRQAALPGQGRGRVRVLGLAAARGADRRSTRDLIAEVNRLGVTTVLDSEGEALRLATRAEPTVVTPERARGRGARRPRVLRRRRPPGRAARDRRAGRARGDHDAADGLRGAASATTASAGSTAWRSRAWSRPVSSVGSGDAFLAGLRRVALRRRHAGRVPALRGRLRRRVGPALRRGRDRPEGGRPAARRGRTVEELSEPAVSARARRLPRRVPANSGNVRATQAPREGPKTVAKVHCSSAAEPRMPPWK